MGGLFLQSPNLLIFWFEGCVILAAFGTNGRFSNSSQPGMGAFVVEGASAVSNGGRTAVFNDVPDGAIEHDNGIFFIIEHHLAQVYSKGTLFEMDWRGQVIVIA